MDVTQVVSPNFHAGRHGDGISGIVIHVMEGTMDSTASWFKSARSQVSAHYGVSKAGEIVQYVTEENTAWHAGRVVSPTAQIVLDHPGVNPNNYTIGIEHEGDGSDDLEDAQRAASVALIKDICARRNIPIDRYHIVAHHEIFSPKTCPGAIDVDALVADCLSSN